MIHLRISWLVVSIITIFAQSKKSMRTIQFREAICEAMSEEMREAVKEYLGWHLLVKAKKI